MQRGRVRRRPRNDEASTRTMPMVDGRQVSSSSRRARGWSADVPTPGRLTFAVIMGERTTRRSASSPCSPRFVAGPDHQSGSGKCSTDLRPVEEEKR